MRHDRIKGVVPRNGREAIGEFLVPITGPQPVPRRSGLMLRHVCRKTVSHCVSLRCDKAKNSDDPLRLEPANVRGRMAEQFAQHVFVVFRIACRAPIDETANMRWRAAEFEWRFSHWPPADLGAVNFGQPLERSQLGVAVAAIFGCLANAGWNPCRLEPLHALVWVEVLGPGADKTVEIVLVGNPRLEVGETGVGAPSVGAGDTNQRIPLLVIETGDRNAAVNAFATVSPMRRSAAVRRAIAGSLPFAPVHRPFENGLPAKKDARLTLRGVDALTFARHRAVVERAKQGLRKAISAHPVEVGIAPPGGHRGLRQTRHVIRSGE